MKARILAIFGLFLIGIEIAYCSYALSSMQFDAFVGDYSINIPECNYANSPQFATTMSEDGKYFYCMNNAYRKIHQYEFSGNNFTGSLTYTNKFLNTEFARYDTYYHFRFSEDGMYIYTNDGYWGNGIRQHKLTTAWDLSTASYEKTFAITYMPFGFDISSDGTHFVGSDGNQLTMYTLSNNFDLGTASVSSTNTFGSNFGAGGRMKPYFLGDDGTKIILNGGGYGTGKFITLELATPYDLSTATVIDSNLTPFVSYPAYGTGVTCAGDTTATFINRNGSVVMCSRGGSDGTQIIFSNLPAEAGGGGAVFKGKNEITPHVYKTGSTFTENGMTCENVLTETGFTYTPYGKWMSGATLFESGITSNYFYNVIQDADTNEIVIDTKYVTGTQIYPDSFKTIGYTNTSSLVGTQKRIIKSEDGVIAEELGDQASMTFIPFGATGGINYFKFNINTDQYNHINNEYGAETIVGSLLIRDRSFLQILGEYNWKKDPYFRFQNYDGIIESFEIDPSRRTVTNYNNENPIVSVRGMEVGNYTYKTDEKKQCKNEKYECKWFYEMDGSYSCSVASEGERSGSQKACKYSPIIGTYDCATGGAEDYPCMILDNNSCVVNSSFTGNILSNGEKIANKNELPSDIFTCPEYKDWTDSFYCIKTIATNIYNVAKKTLDLSTSTRNSTLPGQLKNIGDLRGEKINFGTFSKTGANFADTNYRIFWNGTQDSSNIFIRYGYYALAGTILLGLLAVVISMVLLSNKAKK